eukprot:3933640-Rhodomonas_salina.1
MSGRHEPACAVTEMLGAAVGFRARARRALRARRTRSVKPSDAEAVSGQRAPSRFGGGSRPARNARVQRPAR